MASPFQQQARNRKFVYGGCIIALLGVTWWLRASPIENQAVALAIRERDRGQVALTDTFVRLSLSGVRGMATCILWNTAMEKQKKNQWNELELIVQSLTTLQPHFITPWLFQSWNLAYNVSVESDRPEDKYFYITRGIQLLAEGERRNHHHPDLRWNIGFYTQHKIGRSDETNVLRSIFQLSYVPPNERDPARFWVEADGERKVNLAEFGRFCEKYPQLVRRLRHGMRRQRKGEWRRQFTCENPDDVVRFLEDNWRVPSVYALPKALPVGGWMAQQDTPLGVTERFPVLPPPRPDPYDRSYLTNEETELPDSVNCFEVAKAWYGYAQEPIPLPDELPGSTRPIEHPATQRRPVRITTLLFRVYPAHAERFKAERLQEEGWFMDEGWLIEGWFPRDEFTTAQGETKEARVGTEREWSKEAWGAAYQLWKNIGDDNHLTLSSAEQQNKENLERQFYEGYGLTRNDPLPRDLRLEELPADLRPGYEAALYMFEYRFYRNLGSFPNHLTRCENEAKEAAVRARALFYQAERLDLEASPQPALDKYRDPDGLTGWRDLLLANRAFRELEHVQEETAELKFRYLRLDNRVNGRVLKAKVAKLASALPLLPPVQELPGSITDCPLDVLDEEGKPLIDSRRYDVVIQQLDPSIRFHQPTEEAPPPLVSP